jgi:hypothetical protein
VKKVFALFFFPLFLFSYATKKTNASEEDNPYIPFVTHLRAFKFILHPEKLGNQRRSKGIFLSLN